MPVAVAGGFGLVKMAEASRFDLYDETDLFMFTLQTDLYEREMPKGSMVIVNRQLAPRDDGDLVLVTIHWDTGPATRMLTHYTRRHGCDYRGRFCRSGDPRGGS